MLLPVAVFLLLVFASLEASMVFQLSRCDIALHRRSHHQHYETFFDRRSKPCKVTVEVREDHSVLLTLHNLRQACDVAPDSVLIEENGEDPVNMCEEDSNVILAHGSQVTIRYRSDGGLKFDSEQMSNVIHCGHTVTYREFGRPLVMRSYAENSNVSCSVVVPGRSVVVVEEADLSGPDCSSSLTLHMGSNYYTYEYNLGQMCKNKNSFENDEKNIVCPRGMIQLKTPEGATDTVKFKVLFPDEKKRSNFIIHDLNC
ncbi:hypothetical protein L596_000777 [Steinernema carpocapsae]|uniref:CUB domain-containing protein n=1 Tax=Steinernema carpocapsae TaxID=34508 RepID=A0A4V6I774_STECR|nr:hypothetical protein L596_000777 [Steinernema carpocapsae]